MTANVGTVERVVRFVVGAGLLAFFIFGTGDIRWLGLIGLVFIGTALAGWCPAYRLLGMSTGGR